MNNKLKLSLIGAMLLSTTSAFATNGINQIGAGAKARGMGGVGIATDLKGENAYSNPSMITRTKTAYVNVGVNVFKADVSLDVAGSKMDSKYPVVALPSLSGVYAINESFFVGGSVYAAGGMGVDYTDDNSIEDSLALATIAVPLAYKYQGLSVGVTPLIKYGSLKMPDGTGSTVSSTDTGFGFEVGADYQIDIDETSSITVAGVYKSSVELDYGKDVITTNANENSVLATPSVIGVGVSADVGSSTIALDYKRIGYGSAKGFEDLDWVDQDVFAIGYQYSADVWAVRAGFNYGASPIAADEDNTFGSLFAFPGVTSTHYTVGGSYSINANNEIDLGVVYGTGSQDLDITGLGKIEATNNQMSGAVSYTYNF